MIRERHIRFTAASLAAALLLLPVAVVAQEPRKMKAEEETPTGGEDPLNILKKIERAWQKENADAISSYAGSRKIHLDIRGMGKKGGYFSKSQMKYLLRNTFKNDTQLKFEFAKYHNLDKSYGKVYGIAYRRCKNNRSGKVFQDKVYIMLAREGPVWVVAEIKTTR